MKPLQPKIWYAAVEIHGSDRHVLYIGNSRKDARRVARHAWEHGAERCDAFIGTNGNSFSAPMGPLENPYEVVDVGKVASEGSSRAGHGYTRWLVSDIWKVKL